jgi:hypothetical protein
MLNAAAKAKKFQKPADAQYKSYTIGSRGVKPKAKKRPGFALALISRIVPEPAPQLSFLSVFGDFMVNKSVFRL